GFGDVALHHFARKSRPMPAVSHSTARARYGRRLAPQPYVTRTLALPAAAWALFATYMPFCAPAVQPTAPAQAAEQHMAELWEPRDLSHFDVFNGPWGAEGAPDPHARYEFVKAKLHGVSPG